MIYQMTRDLEEHLHAREYPVKVDYDEGERLKHANRRSYEILVGRDVEAGDAVRAIVASRENPKNTMVRDLGVAAYFYVQARRRGATLQEHQHDCDDLVDAFLVSLRDWFVASGAGTQVPVKESRYLTADEYNGSEHFSGVVYRLRFLVPRAVARRKYGGGARDVATLEAVDNKFEARLMGGAKEEVNGIPT